MIYISSDTANPIVDERHLISGKIPVNVICVDPWFISGRAPPPSLSIKTGKDITPLGEP